MSAILQFIRDNHILAMVEVAKHSKKLRLNLNNFNIIHLPSLLYACYEVEQLFLHRNKIIYIAPEFGDLVNLTTLTLDYNNIKTLPKEIRYLKKLMNLNISNNPLTELIPEIGELESLEAFWCNKTGIQELPKEIGKLTNLDTFGARGNELTSLPDEFTNLVQLRWLTLEKNKISSLPANMDKMQGLVHANFNHNRFVEFPMMMLNCVNIMYLKFDFNLISHLPEKFDISKLTILEVIDIKNNPICLRKPVHVNQIIKYGDATPEQGASPSRGHATQALVANATALRMPAAPAAAPIPPRPQEEQMIVEDNGEGSSTDDWENSVNTSEINEQYNDEVIGNETNV